MRPVIVLLLVVLMEQSPTLGEEEKLDSLGDRLPQGAVQRLGTLRMKFGCAGLAYLPDGSGVMLRGGYVEIWDLAKGERRSQTKVSAAPLTSVDVRSDRKVLLLGDRTGKVREWDVAAHKELRSWDTHQGELRSACYSPDERRVLTAGNSPPGLKEWDLDTGKLLLEVKSRMVRIRPGAIYGPQGKSAILGGGFDHNLEHYDLASGKLLKAWCSIYEAKCLALSPDEKYLTVGLEDRAVEWCLEDYTKFHDYKHCPGEAARIFSVAYVPSRDEVLCGGRDGSIHRWSRKTGKRVFTWRPHQSAVTLLCLSPDEKWVLSYGTSLVAETNILTGEPRLKWDRHAGSVEAVAFLPPGKQLASGSSDATIRVWNVVTGKTELLIHNAGFGVYALAVSPDGSRIAAGCKDSAIRVSSASDGKLLRELRGHRGYIRSLAYTRDGRLLSSADDGSICVWKRSASKPVVRLEGHRGGVLAVAVSPDDKLALSGGRDGTVRVWDLAKGKLLKTCEAHRGWVCAVAFVPESRCVVSAGYDGRVLRWDLNSDKPEAEMHLAHRGHWALACSPDGRRVYAAGKNRGWACRDLQTGEKIAEATGHRQAVQSLAVSPGGDLLATGSQDTTLLVWKINPTAQLGKP